VALVARLMLTVPRLLSTIRTWILVVAWREAAWISVGQLVGAVGAVIGVRMLTGLMQPIAFGELALGLTGATLVFQVVLGPLVNACERFFSPARDTGQTSAFFAALGHLTLRASGIILVPGLLLASVLLILGRLDWLLLVGGATAFALLSGWESIIDGIQNAARQRRAVALHQAMRQWIRPCFAVLLLSVTATATGGTGMVAYAFGSLIVLGSQFWLLRRTLAFDPQDTPGPERAVLQRQMLTYAVPFGTWGVFTWTQASSDRWALQLMSSATDVGLYAIVAQLGSYPVHLFGAALTQLVAPMAYSGAGSGTDQRSTASALRLCILMAVAMVGLTALLTAATALAHDLVFATLVGPQYRGVSSFLPVAVLSSGLFVVGQMLSLLPMVLGNSKALLAPKIGTALLGLLLNLSAAYLFGLPGVLWAGVLFSLCYICWVAIVALPLLGGCKGKTQWVNPLAMQPEVAR
jgi:O-antigen/teichoic acid export membrane protein